jgi:tetratricopeptide (TPR) repeat protein
MKSLRQLCFIAALAVLSIQYLGCGGAEISSAKLYRNQRNYVKANEMLEKALKSDPTSDEGWALYVTNLFDLKRYERIAEVIDTARIYAVENRTQVEFIRRNTFVELFNGGLQAYEQNPDSRQQQKEAIALLETARRVAPEMPETYELLGNVYYSANDTAKAIGTFQEALAQLRSMHDQGTALGLMLKMDPASVVNAIGGDPARTQTVLYGSDSVLIYIYPSKEAYIYFEKTKRTPRKWQLMGWKFTNIEAVGMQPSRISLATYQNVASYYLAKGSEALARKDKAAAEAEFDKAVSYLISIQRLDPSDPQPSSIIPDIYRRLGQTDKAKAEYERMISEFPSKNLYSSYGVVLLNSEDYDGAIAAFEKALEIDPAYHNALVNLAATYQNRAVAQQKKDPKASVNSLLEKAVEYFEKAYTVNSKDYFSIGYLIEDYDILGNKEKKQKFLTILDNLASTDVASEHDYWAAVGKAFVKTDAKKSTEAFRKADELLKNK